MRYSCYLVILFAFATVAPAQVAIQGETVYTMNGAPIKNGVVLLRDGKVEKVGPASSVSVPGGYQKYQAKVVTPGLIDARTVVGLSGYMNQPHDQDQLENSAPIQPELRAIDAYDPKERLIEWVRGFGITTIHTGHGVGALISGQTMVIKTNAETADQAMVPAAMIAASIGDDARAERGKSPGTRSKMVAMLRAELIKAQESTKKAADKDKKDGARDLRNEAMQKLIKGEMPLLLHAHRANDVLTAIRVAKEFNLKLVLDGVAEAPEILPQLKSAGYPIILHPTMERSYGDAESLSMETASKLSQAGLLFALQSGFEGYVPKTRVVLWEAAVAAGNGLPFDKALASITIDAARILGLEKRIGSLEPGKDGDVALYDGDPFEYTSHCTGVFINGASVSNELN